MITPSFELTATERVLPRLALDFTTASLDSRITFSRALNTATRINASGLVEVVNADVPRFDYNPTTLACNGLLIEESRINNLAYSEDFTNTSGWTPAQASVVSASIANPSGVLLSSELIENSTTNLHSVQTASGFSFISGTSYTYSVFAKQGSGTRLLNLRPSSTATFAANAVFNLQNGTVSSTALGTASIRSYGNGWYRCSVTGTAGATSSTGLVCFLVSTGTTINYQGNGTSSIYLWGAQLETGAFLTSYIPNVATGTTTRNADVATMTGTNFSSWFNASEGTFKVQCQTMNFAALRGIYAAGDPTKAFAAAEVIFANYAATSGNLTDNVLAGGVAQAGMIPTKTQTINTTTKNVFAYKLNSFAGSTDAGTVATDNSGTVATPTGLSLGNLTQGWSGATNYLNGYLEKFYYWPQRLINAEVQAFSK